MKTKILPVILLLSVLGSSAMAQTKDKPSKEKKESITIRKKTDDKEKVTIVIDGDNITVNGKPIDQLKDEDIEVIRNRTMAMGPRFKGRIAPAFRTRVFGDAFGDRKERALLGVTSQKDGKGAKITEVNKESAAEKAGLKKDDIITRINDHHIIENSEDLYNSISDFKPGEKITITYLRDGKQLTTTATLGKTDAPRVQSFKFNGDDFNGNFNFDMPKMRGLENLKLDMVRRPRLGMGIQDQEDGKGVKVLDVDDESVAAKAGLQKGDVVTEIDGKTVSSVDELREKLRTVKEGDTLKLTYLRDGKTNAAEVKFPRKLKTAEL